MKTAALITTLLAATLITGVAFADDDCHDPIADWQSRETLRQMLEAQGWKIHRIKVDDGCYEVKGLDQHGNTVKAEYLPASLRLRKLQTKYKNATGRSDNLSNQHKQQTREQRSNPDHHENGDRP